MIPELCTAALLLTQATTPTDAEGDAVVAAKKAAKEAVEKAKPAAAKVRMEWRVEALERRCYRLETRLKALEAKHDELAKRFLLLLETLKREHKVSPSRPTVNRSRPKASSRRLRLLGDPSRYGFHAKGVKLSNLNPSTLQCYVSIHYTGEGSRILSLVRFTIKAYNKRGKCWSGVARVEDFTPGTTRVAQVYLKRWDTNKKEDKLVKAEEIVAYKVILLH